jgi:hypothetical protein
VLVGGDIISRKNGGVINAEEEDQLVFSGYILAEPKLDKIGYHLKSEAEPTPDTSCVKCTMTRL